MNMKKFFSLLVMAIIAIQFSFADDVITKDINRLPQQARSFISTYFPDCQLQHIKIDKDVMSTSYEVYMVNGIEVDFDGKGNWTDVDTEKSGSKVPDELIPDFVTNYMKANGFTNEYVVKIDRDRSGYDVELNTGVSLEFTNSGKFKKADD